MSLFLRKSLLLCVVGLFLLLTGCGGGGGGGGSNVPSDWDPYAGPYSPEGTWYVTGTGYAYNASSDEMLYVEINGITTIETFGTPGDEIVTYIYTNYEVSFYNSNGILVYTDATQKESYPYVPCRNNYFAVINDTSDSYSRTDYYIISNNLIKAYKKAGGSCNGETVSTEIWLELQK